MTEKPKPQPDEWEFEGKRYAGKHPGPYWRFNDKNGCWELLLINVYRGTSGIVNTDVS